VKLNERVKTILRTLTLLLAPGSIAELRIPKADGGPLVGLFNDLDEMAEVAARQSGKVPGIYFLLNELKESAKRRVDNQLTKATSAVKDTDIERRRWLPIDFDPVRPSNTPSTDSEHDAAMAVAKECRAWLREQGLPEPILADSGNGAHLLYRIDLPNDGPSYELVKDCLEALSLKFSSGEVVVDTGNANASRIWRLYGTFNCKGEASDDRPYGRATLVKVPDDVEVVSREQLNELASMLPATSEDSRKEQLDVAGWIEENNVPVVADAPWKNGGYKWILQCPWDESHTNKSGYIVQFPDGGIAAGCLHKSCAGKNWPDLRAEFEQRSGVTTQEDSVSPIAKSPSGQKETQTKVLLELASELELFLTPQGEPYAAVPVKGHRENHPIKSRGFERFLRYQYFSVTQTAPRPQAVHDAVSHFDAVARFNSPTKPVFVRVAAADGVNYLDLADDQWRAIAFDADGWRIIENPPVKFRRTPGMLALPTTVRSGDINELRKFLNLRTDDDWILFITTLLGALMSRGPFPVVGLHGEAGSAKTTTSRIVKAMIDPNTSPARAMPREPRDLMIMANNSWVLVFDNLSYLPPWFSDCLCRLSTGGGFSTRILYTDAEEMVFEGQRPVVLNGVEELANRTDLIDRSILFDLPVIESYRQEREFWNQFEAEHPRLLGALLDVAVDALRNLPEIRIRETPRMADFATFATAAESALGLSEDAFMSAYSRNRQDANAVALEASPIASVVSDLADMGRWEGTAEQLLRKLSTMTEEEVQRRRSWPKTPRMLSGMLRRLATALRRAGIEVQFSRENTSERTRKITIRRRRTREK